MHKLTNRGYTSGQKCTPSHYCVTGTEVTNKRIYMYFTIPSDQNRSGHTPLPNPLEKTNYPITEGGWVRIYNYS